MIEHRYGLEDRCRNIRLFFGHRESSLANLQTEFPNLRFLRVKQVHGNQIIESRMDTADFQIPADGHITSEKGLALCSITGDCVPVLIAAPDVGWIGAFHAGWRGVAGRIVPRGIQCLLAKGARAADLRIWIGPHILQDSFEVEADVRDQILGSLPPRDAGPDVANWATGPVATAHDSLYWYQERPAKFKVSLVQVLLEQISACGILRPNIDLELDDTLTNPQFHSARRDREKSGRQISWIALE